ncbi:hypothetical protein F4556_006448 [Kitasatospora gansuensis]|uniref:Secreted protein n=1 Tax=Kitasatospora gansuensis TaxID=258050 RepID=A0A7W7SI53_9ACTN|nr:hypothetical protein [Kitasatospora gansuensis]MBB4950913.1 hypothetical protein [Kitasatospora gansuensis]
MYTALLFRGARAAAVAALALTSGLTGIGTADATGRTGSAPVPIEVRIGASGIQAPASAPGGLVTFHVTTDDPAGRALQVFRPKAGITLDQVLADFTKAVASTDPADTANGISAVEHEAEALGGVTVVPAVAGSATTEISPGTVYLLDFTAFLQDQSAPVLRSLELCAGPSADLAEFPDGIVITEETAGGPRFRTENVTLADGRFLVHNASDEIHEMTLQQVPDGTTDAQLQAIYDAILAGNPPPQGGPAPLSVGLGGISPGRTALYHAEHLPPGTYALICFVPDHESGLPHAFLGMHKVVVLA